MRTSAPPAAIPGAAAPSLNVEGPLRAEEWFERERAFQAGRVRRVFERLFSQLFPERDGPEGELAETLLVPDPDLDALAQRLPAFGLAPSRQNAREVVALAQETSPLANPSRTRRYFASLAPALLKALAATGDPEAALRRFSRIAGSLGGKAIFYQSLHENSWLLRMTADLAAWSEYLTDVLVANPGLFDEVVEALRTGQAKSCAQMEAELAQLAVGGEIADTLRAYRAGELLRIGVRDLFHAAPLEQTQSELSDLAAALLRAQLAHTRKAFTAARGEVRGADGTPAGFAILAVGKFGGCELNYGSDLDVLFFYEPEGATPDGLPATPYFTELAQDLSRAMGTPTSLGNLYTVDARLRPNGSKGPLASSLAAFERYWKDGALADWERLALTRARYVAGDSGVGERAEHLVRSAVYSPLRTRTLAEEVRRMRKRLEDTAEPGNLKRGRGGIVDIEFLTQYLQLLHGPAYPPVRQTNTRAALKALLRLKKLSADDGRQLLAAFEFLTLMANRVRIVHGLSANALPTRPEDLRKLALRAGYQDTPGHSAGEALLADCRRQTEAVRGLFEKLVQ
jgi:glutamate-ammonia-ligase adenylyltransferase